ncbi:MAG: beta/gamma crystallin-related protein [Pseudomonadota bacterium]|nr:beta/gamma crystallin-related protein [Pseudomonadota bacterium]
MNSVLKVAMAVATVAFAGQVAAEVIFFEGEGFQGRSFKTAKPVRNFESFGFNDRASSVVVTRERWEVCENARFEGRCVVLRPGRYASLAAMGLNDRVSSVRIVSRQARIEDNRYAPPPVPVYDSRRRKNEQLYQADVRSVRAVVGRPEQRCWVEREQVSQGRGDTNVGGAIAGAVIGGILGHQVGGGRGKDLATAGGAVAGAAVGANVGRDGAVQSGYSQDVRRCENVPSQAQPSYWDVVYNFRGQEHRIQMASPPGRTVTVNGRGEPRT